MQNKRTRILKTKFDEAYNRSSQNDPYITAGERMSLDEKEAVLERLGRRDLIDLFKDWKPRKYTSKKMRAPLDQRISLTVTSLQRQKLEAELRSLKQAGETVSMAAYIRGKCVSIPDIQEWAQIAEKALQEIEDTIANQKHLEQRRLDLAVEIENSEDDEFENMHIMDELNEINRKLNKLNQVNTQRSHRLSGRMTMKEAQLIKYRAERLCLTVSDYLRMMVFSLKPDSSISDSHLSLAAKRRFYVSICAVAENGWGNPPQVYECSQCQEYLEENQRLQREIEALRNFSE